MIELDPPAQSRLEEYLGRVRSTLRGCRSVDTDEVERDILDHIESDLADAPRPVAAECLQTVLDKLGSPSQWVPAEERAWWWKALGRLRDGPEDFRLAYLTFAAFVLAVLLWPFWSLGPILMAQSFLLARATVSFRAEKGGMQAERWLIYPPLIVVCLFLALLVLLGPISWVGFVFDAIEPLARGRRLVTAGARWAALTLPLAPAWWIVVGIFCRVWPGLFAAIFAPFITPDRSRRIGKWLIWIGAIICSLAVVAAVVAAVFFGLGMTGGSHLR